MTGFRSLANTCAHPFGQRILYPPSVLGWGRVAPIVILRVFAARSLARFTRASSWSTPPAARAATRGSSVLVPSSAAGLSVLVAMFVLIVLALVSTRSPRGSALQVKEAQRCPNLPLLQPDP